MNENFTRLTKIAEKPTRLIAGLMSGTSLDGLDVALCEFSGSGRETKAVIREFKTVSFYATRKDLLKAIVSRDQVSLRDLTRLNAATGRYYGEIVLDCLSEWKVEAKSVDLIASHGQTVYHYSPASNEPHATLQIGDGDQLAFKTGIITISDFRQKNIAAGGQGAPLVPYGDFILFSSKAEDRVLLNIGGIANFTYLPAGGTFNQVVATDTGPGNTLMDQFVQHSYPGLYFDQNALIAGKGVVSKVLLKELMSSAFFLEAIPRSTGPELFNLPYLNAAKSTAGVQLLSPEDTLSTLCAFSAQTIASTIRASVPAGRAPKMYVSGGGARNPLLWANIQELLPETLLKTSASLGVDPDAKEALLFALLANETVAGDPKTFTNDRGIPAVSMGKISLPH